MSTRLRKLNRRLVGQRKRHTYIIIFVTKFALVSDPSSIWERRKNQFALSELNEWVAFCRNTFCLASFAVEIRNYQMWQGSWTSAPRDGIVLNSIVVYKWDQLKHRNKARTKLKFLNFLNYIATVLARFRRSG
jgi:hypothetical protein